MRHFCISFKHFLNREYSVSPNMRSSSGYTALHYAALYGRRELYNELIIEHEADKNIVDFSGVKPEFYLENNFGHGPNNKGINKSWQDLALDLQNYHKQCFEESQREQRNGKQDPKCFEGIKKRHSIGY